MFDVRLPSRKSLFRLQGERLLALERLSNAPPGSIPWYVMTSAATDQETRNYFRKERFFGLRPPKSSSSSRASRRPFSMMVVLPWRRNPE